MQIETPYLFGGVASLINIIGILIVFNVKATLRRLEHERDARDKVLSDLAFDIKSLSKGLTFIEGEMKAAAAERARILTELLTLQKDSGEYRARLEGHHERIRFLEKTGWGTTLNK